MNITTNLSGKVTILMSVYNPCLTYFKKQLESLNNQDYNNIELLIWVDDPKNNIKESVIKSYITNFPYKIIRANKNLGYVKAFEELTKLANSEFIAYCDQDDIWENNKLSICISELIKQNAVLSTCDRTIIDKDDNIIISSIRHSSNTPEITWNSGDDITKYAIFSCYTTGMTIVMRTSTAKACLPFPSESAHDKWIGACASVMGKVLFIDIPLVNYRRHKNNVSGILSDINSKNEYYDKRVVPIFKLTQIFAQKFPNLKDNNEILKFADARYNRKVLTMFKYRYLSPLVTKFEILLKFTPNSLFKLFKKCFM